MARQSTAANAAAIAIQASYLDWSAALGGALAAAAAAFIFVSFGSAVGLGVVSPWAPDATSPTTVGIIAAAWFLVSSGVAYYCGGYVAGRLRGTRGDATESEVETRDALHGVVVWALGVFVFVWVGTSTVQSVTTGVAATTGAAAGALGAVAQSEDAEDLAEYTVDKLFRTTSVRLTSPSEDLREETARVLARAISDGQISVEDKQYLVQLVAANTSLTESEAEARVDQVFAEANAAAEEAAAAAEEVAKTAQNAALLAGFLIAAGFLVALVAAWFGAVLGGSHRDQNIVSRVFVVRRPL